MPRPLFYGDNNITGKPPERLPPLGEAVTEGD